MKKVISLFVAVLMVVLTFSITATSAIAAEATGSISGAVTTAKIGESFDFTISLDKNPGFVNLQVKVGYDTNIFTLTKVTNGTVHEKPNFSRNLTKNPYTLTWEGDTFEENVTATGTLATLTFTVSDNTELIGSVSPITLTVTDSLNFDLDDVNFAATNGQITLSHDHTWEDDWTNDDTHHWKECNLHDAINEKAAHIAATPVEENRIEPADCTTDGSYDLVTYCSVCGYEMSRENKVIKAPGHKWATAWSIDSEYHWRVCTVCGDIEEKAEHYSNGTVQENLVPATCTAEGSYDEVTYCADCGYELGRETFIIDKTPHTPAEAVEENIVPATCTADGSYDEVIYCADCGTELSREKITINKIPHTPAEAVEENVVPATCTADGSYDEVVYCNECGTELSREIKITKKLGHDFSEKWTDDSTFHWHACSRCDAIKDKQKHNLVLAESGNYVCDVCDHELNVTKDAYVDFEKTELARPGRELKAIVKLNNADKALAFALSDITYDKSALSLKSVKWISQTGGLSSWDEGNGTFAIMFVEGMNTQVENKDINGDIVELTFDVLEDAEDGEYEIGLDCQYITESSPVYIPTINEKVTLRRFLPGDLNEDEKVTSDDSLYLLFHLFFPEIYEANQPVDFNGDKAVDIKDAIHLLFYVYFPEYYKLNY